MKNLTVKKLNSNELVEFKALIHLFNRVFEEDANQIAHDDQLKKLLMKPEFMVFVAMTEDKIIGGFTAYELHSYYKDHSEAYLYDIAVDSAYQNQGTGKDLIHALKTYCASHNIKTVFVEAHEEDSGSLEFYKRTGASDEKVVHFNYHM